MIINNIITICKCGLGNLCGYSYYSEYEILKDNDFEEIECYCGLCNCFRETSYFLFRKLIIKEKHH